MLMKPEKHGAEIILLKLINYLIYMITMLIKHGSRIIIVHKFPKEPPCFQEFQNQQRMEGAMNI